MHRLSIKATTNVGFIGALVLLLGFAAISYRQISEAAAKNEWVIHTYKVQEQLLTFQSALITARSEVRGYLATHEKKYVERYREESRNANESLGRTKSLTADNPLQQQRIQQLRSALSETLGLLDREVNLGGGPQSTALMPAVQEQIDQV